MLSTRLSGQDIQSPLLGKRIFRYQSTAGEPEFSEARGGTWFSIGTPNLSEDMYGGEYGKELGLGGSNLVERLASPRKLFTAKIASQPIMALQLFPKNPLLLPKWLQTMKTVAIPEKGMVGDMKALLSEKDPQKLEEITDRRRVAGVRAAARSEKAVAEMARAKGYDAIHVMSAFGGEGTYFALAPSAHSPLNAKLLDARINPIEGFQKKGVMARLRALVAKIHSPTSEGLPERLEESTEARIARLHKQHMAGLKKYVHPAILEELERRGVTYHPSTKAKMVSFFGMDMRDMASYFVGTKQVVYDVDDAKALTNLVHETGHAVDMAGGEMIREYAGEPLPKYLKKFTEEDAAFRHQEINSYDHLGLPALSKDVEMAGKHWSDVETGVKLPVSRYGGESSYENFAEAFVKWIKAPDDWMPKRKLDPVYPKLFERFLQRSQENSWKAKKSLADRKKEAWLKTKEARAKAKVARKEAREQEAIWAQEQKAKELEELKVAEAAKVAAAQRDFAQKQKLADSLLQKRTGRFRAAGVGLGIGLASLGAYEVSRAMASSEVKAKTRKYNSQRDLNRQGYWG